MQFFRSNEGRSPEGVAEANDRKRRLLATIAGISAAVAVAALGIGGWQMVNALQIEARYSGSARKVVTAAGTIDAGHVIEEADLAIQEVPGTYVPEDAVTDTGGLVGRRALTLLSDGMPIGSSAVAGASSSGTLATSISDGMVAYAIAVDTTTGMSPLVHVGDAVTLYGNYGGGQETEVLAEGARVIALGGSLSDKGEYDTMTLELDPEQARAAFKVASAGGHLRVVGLPAREAE